MRGDRGEAGQAHRMLLVKGIQDRCWSRDTLLHPPVWRLGPHGGCSRRGQSRAMLSIHMGCAPGLAPTVPPEPRDIPRQTAVGHQNQAGMVAGLS